MTAIDDFINETLTDICIGINQFNQTSNPIKAGFPEYVHIEYNGVKLTVPIGIVDE